MATSSALLEVNDLRTHFMSDRRVIRSVDGVSFSVQSGRTVCIVGESGSGKSVTARSILGLVDAPGKIIGGQILWRGGIPEGLTRPRDQREVEAARVDADTVDLARANSKSEFMRRMRGGKISMIFQEPMASLSPNYTIGDHLVEAIRLHSPIGRREAWELGVSLLDRVGIHQPAERMAVYPFQLSGGMCQRVMIAIALSSHPSLIIADEPTTALDVTTQARILALLRKLQSDTNMAMLFITHDLGVVAEIADDVVVMLSGRVVEQGTVDQIFHAPQHEYTQKLLASIPRMTRFEDNQARAS